MLDILLAFTFAIGKKSKKMHFSKGWPPLAAFFCKIEGAMMSKINLCSIFGWNQLIESSSDQERNTRNEVAFLFTYVMPQGSI